MDLIAMTPHLTDNLAGGFLYLEFTKTSVVNVATTYLEVPEYDKARCGQLSCSCRQARQPQLLQCPRQKWPWLNGPLATVCRITGSDKFIVRSHISLGNRFILPTSLQALPIRKRGQRQSLPTMTFLSANGLPHSLVSKDRKRLSPVFNKNVSRSGPSHGSKPARAASVSAFIQAVVFAANPSGLE